MNREAAGTIMDNNEREGSRRAGLVGGAANVEAAWHRLYERLLRLEFDGYAGADPDVFLRAMETVLSAHRADPGAQPVEIFRQLFDEAIAELDRTQPQRA